MEYDVVRGVGADVHTELDVRLEHVVPYHTIIVVSVQMNTIFHVHGEVVTVDTTPVQPVSINTVPAIVMDLVVLDMVMPGMGGGEVFDAIKAIKPEVKILLSSGYSQNGQAQEILARGCNGFIQKPFDMVRLSQAIEQILSHQNPRS